MGISNRLDDILFLRKLEELNLLSMWDYISRSNPAKANGYHHTGHMFEVAKLAWKIWSVEVGEKERADDHHDFTLKTLLIACLWHDYDHSAGLLPDEDNIKVALVALDNWRAMPEYHDIAEKIFDSVTPWRVGELVRVTEFPFIHEPRYLAEKIIRDADLLYTFADTTGPSLYGLWLELSGSGKFPEDFTFDAMVEGQRAFHDKVQLYTLTGLAIHRDLKDRVIKEQMHYRDQLSDLRPGHRATAAYLEKQRALPNKIPLYTPLPKEGDSE